MVIQSSKDRFYYVISLFFIYTVVYFVFLSMDIGIVFPTVFYVFLILNCIQDWICYCRVLIMDDQGCTVRFLWFARHYTWSEFKMKKRIDYTNRSRTCGYKASVVFSPVNRNIPNWMFADEYSDWCHPFTCIYVNFRTNRVVSKFAREQPDLYVVDEMLFEEKMAEWGVEITKS